MFFNYCKRPCSVFWDTDELLWKVWFLFQALLGETRVASSWGLFALPLRQIFLWNRWEQRLFPTLHSCLLFYNCPPPFLGGFLTCVGPCSCQCQVWELFPGLWGSLPVQHSPLGLPHRWIALSSWGPSFVLPSQWDHQALLHIVLAHGGPGSSPESWSLPWIFPLEDHVLTAYAGGWKAVVCCWCRVSCLRETVHLVSILPLTKVEAGMSIFQHSFLFLENSYFITHNRYNNHFLQ